MSIRFIKKVMRRLNQSLPDGLVSPCYLWPFQTQEIRLRRQIWWASKHAKSPRPIWLVFQLIYWLRWVLFEGWVNTFKVVKFYHAKVTQHYNVSYGEQLRRCLWGAIGWSILPNDLYTYQIIQTRGSLFEFIYTNEVIGWHALQNRAHPNARAGQKLLGDKHTFAQVMRDKGFRVVQECTHPTPQDLRSFSEQFQPDQGAVFCKLNKGNQALHAFAAYWIDGDLRGHLQTGQALNSAADVDAAWDRLISHGSPIVQPCLRNHPQIAPISNSNRIANLRVITRENRIGAANIALYSSDEIGDTFWMDIDPKAGHPFLPSSMYPQHHPKLIQLQTFAQNAPKTIPYWDQICADSLRAHGQEFDLWAIAWDWAVTPEGPILLEGNAGWGLHDWQLQNGGLSVQAE